MLTFEERVLCGNSLQRFGSGLEPDPEPTRESGPVANTTHDQLPVRFAFLTKEKTNEWETLLGVENWFFREITHKMKYCQ